MHRNQGTSMHSALRTLAVITVASLLHINAGAAQASQEQLLAVLTSNAPLNQKWVAAQDLARLGTGEAVPKLAALLPDDQLSDLARYTLRSEEHTSELQSLRHLVCR